MSRMMASTRFGAGLSKFAGFSVLALAAAALHGCSSDTLTPSIPAATTFSATDANVAATFASFQAAIGGVNNGNTAAPQSGGRREINWDGVVMSQSDFNSTGTLVNPHTLLIRSDRFGTRGVRLLTGDPPSVGAPDNNPNNDVFLAVSDNGFASANPSTAGLFNAFSPTKTFAPFNQNVTEVDFFLPTPTGTAPTAAGTTAFGAVFLDVSQPGTSIEAFNGSRSLGRFPVPVSASGGTSFLGIQYGSAVITSVKITTGTAVLANYTGSPRVLTSGPSDTTTTDQVAMDDFIYAEPTTPVILPGSAFGF